MFRATVTQLYVMVSFPPTCPRHRTVTNRDSLLWQEGDEQLHHADELQVLLSQALSELVQQLLAHKNL